MVSCGGSGSLNGLAVVCRRWKRTMSGVCVEAPLAIWIEKKSGVDESVLQKLSL